MKFKLDDFEIKIIQHTVQIIGGGDTRCDSCTDGDEGCCDSDQVTDDECNAISFPPLQ